MKVHGFSLACTLSVLGLLSAGCPSDLEDPSGGDGSDGSSTGTDQDTDGNSGPGTTNASNATTTSPPPGDTTAGDGMDSVGFITAGSTDGGPGDPQPNGAQCSGNDGCESGFCYQVPMIGGVCSECLMDADCGSGTCALDIGLLYAVCTDGSLGSMCDSDEGCMGELTCETVVNTGGFFDINTCSECGSTADCAGGQVCSPVYDVANISGHLSCVDEMSVPDGGGCPWDMGAMSGDGSVCVSGVCGPADLFGVVTLGVCGECASDMDCTMMQTCTPASADMSGITPSTCN